jgi:hypothetical protein
MAGGQHGEIVTQAYPDHRAHPVDLAFRMLGDIGSAEDVVQGGRTRTSAPTTARWLPSGEPRSLSPRPACRAIVNHDQSTAGEQMKVLAIGHLTGKDIRPHLEAEGRRVAELRAKGLIRDVLLKADRSGPVLVLSDTTAEKAREQLASLPFVEQALVAFEYIELNDAPPA